MEQAVRTDDEAPFYDFHIVEGDFTVPTMMPPIGRDILTKYCFKIDFETLTIIFSFKKKYVVVSIRSKPTQKKQIIIKKKIVWSLTRK